MKSIVKSTPTHKGISLSKVREIRKLYGEMQSLFLAALEKAIRMGEILSEIKEELPYGEFTTWVEASGMPFKVRTAQLYMRLYERQEELRTAGIENVREAQKFLSSGGNIDSEEAQRVALLEPQVASNDAGSESINTVNNDEVSAIKLTAREQQLVAEIIAVGGEKKSAENGIRIQKWKAKKERERKQKEKQQLAQIKAKTDFKSLEVSPHIYRRFSRLAKKTGRPITDLLEEAADTLTRKKKGN